MSFCQFLIKNELLWSMLITCACVCQLMDQLSTLPSTYRQLVSDAVTVRQDDIRHALSDSVGNVSHATLKDFNWTTKVTLSQIPKCLHNIKSKVNTNIAVRNRNHLTATGNHLPCGITLLPATQQW